MDSRGMVVFSVVFLCQVAIFFGIRFATVHRYGQVAYFGAVAALCIALLMTMPDDDSE